MDRKEIVKALEEHAGVKAKYMGAPSFAYQIVIAEEIFIIDRIGKITTADGTEVEFQKLLRGTIEEEANETGFIECEVGVPLEGHTGGTLRNLVNMIYSKQVLIKNVFEFKEDIIDSDLIININSAEVQTLDDFKNIIENEKVSSCPGIRFNFFDGNITFKFGRNLQDPEKLKAYTQFVSLLNESAKAQKYASPKPTVTDNKKFTMRTWLIRLGFVGTEYKKARKILLQNLEGNGSFRKVKTSADSVDE